MNNNYIPNTSSIPNVLFDFWMDKLSPAEFKVLMCIARKTYGWHKDFDLISIKQIEKMTGLSRKGIIKNIEVLMSYDLLIKIKSKTPDGDDAPNRYTINVNCMGGGSELSTLGVVNSVHQGGSVLSTPTKERLNTKQNLQNTPPPLPPPKNSGKSKAAIAAEEVGNSSSSSSFQKKPAEPKRKVAKEYSPRVVEFAQKILKIAQDNEPTYRPPKDLTSTYEAASQLLEDENQDADLLLNLFEWAAKDTEKRGHVDNRFNGWRGVVCNNKAGGKSTNPVDRLRYHLSNISAQYSAKTVRRFAPCSDDNQALRLIEEMSKDAL